MACVYPKKRHAHPPSKRPSHRSVPDGLQHWRPYRSGPADRCGYTQGNQCATPLNYGNNRDSGQCRRHTTTKGIKGANLRSRLPVSALVPSRLILSELTTLSCSTTDASMLITFKIDTQPESRPTITCGRQQTWHQLKSEKWNVESNKQNEIKSHEFESYNLFLSRTTSVLYSPPFTPTLYQDSLVLIPITSHLLNTSSRNLLWPLYIQLKRETWKQQWKDFAQQCVKIPCRGLYLWWYGDNAICYIYFK